MNNYQMYKVVVTDYFKRQLKKLVKKDRGLKENLKKALLSFNREAAISIGFCVYAKNRTESISFEEVTAHLQNVKVELANLL